MSAFESCGSRLNASALPSEDSQFTFLHFHKATKTSESGSVVVVIIMAGMIAAPSTANQPQERLGTVQVIAIMSSELFEVTSCMTS